MHAWDWAWVQTDECLGLLWVSLLLTHSDKKLVVVVIRAPILGVAHTKATQTFAGK